MQELWSFDHIDQLTPSQVVHYQRQYTYCHHGFGLHRQSNDPWDRIIVEQRPLRSPGILPLPWQGFQAVGFSKHATRIIWAWSYNTASRSALVFSLRQFSDAYISTLLASWKCRDVFMHRTDMGIGLRGPPVSLNAQRDLEVNGLRLLASCKMRDGFAIFKAVSVIPPHPLGESEAYRCWAQGSQDLSAAFLC